MKKENIDILTSVISTPQRGNYGDAKFPGNCSGNGIKILLNYFKPKYVLDPMEGSGTCRDVCREMKIKYDGFDINNKKDMYTFKFKRKYDLIHWHPPYFRMCRDLYLEMTPKKFRKNNLAFPLKWDEYCDKLFDGFDILWNQLNPGGVLLVLNGLRKMGNNIYDANFELKINFLDKYSFEIIKIQYVPPQRATHGSGSKYATTKKQPSLYGHKFIPLKHEVYLLFKKPKIKLKVKKKK